MLIKRITGIFKKKQQPLVTFSDDEEYITRTAKLFEAGDYPDKGINVTEADIGKTVSSFTDPVDIKIEHIDTPLDGAMGQVSTIFRHGKELFGKVRFPKTVWSLIKKSGATKLSVGLDRRTMSLREVSLTKKPRISEAAIFSVTEDAVGAVGEILFDHNDTASSPEGTPLESDQENKTEATGQSVSNLLKLLSDVLDFTLPVDTTGENFIERSITALTAIQGSKEEAPEDGTIREQPRSGKEQPGPVTMTKELEFTLDLLNKGGVTNPSTSKPYTESEIAELSNEDDSQIVQMSEADQATVSWAKNQMLTSYKQRIEMCVKQGKVPAKQANELWAGMEAQANLGTLTFAFDTEGKPQHTHFDYVIEAWENMPSNVALTGLSPTAAAQRTQLLDGSAAFSLTSGMITHTPPEFSEPDDPNKPLTDEEADAILAIQWSNSGKRQSEVDGGYKQVQTASTE